MAATPTIDFSLALLCLLKPNTVPCAFYLAPMLLGF